MAVAVAMAMAATQRWKVSLKKRESLFPFGVRAKGNPIELKWN